MISRLLCVLMLFVCQNSFATQETYPTAPIPDYVFEVAHSTNLPAMTLYAISLQESRHLVDGVWHAWPGAVRIGNDSRWFETAEQGQAFIERFLEEGGNPIAIDVGMTQINYFYHKDFIDSVGFINALDPRVNLQYTAKTLRRCMDTRKESLIDCVGRHNNSDPVVAGRYLSSISQRLSEIAESR